MKVKQFRAVTLQEAFAAAQAEFGEDAVLLHQKEVIQQAGPGRRGQTLVEITVGLDEPAQSELRPPAPQPATPSLPRFTPGPAPAESAEFQKLRRELAEIRSLLQRRDRNAGDLPEALAAWSDALYAGGLPSHWIDRLLDGLDEMLTPAALGRAELVAAALHRRLAAEMTAPIGPLQPGKSGQPLVFVLVGPTGVGKTTTIAKLAAHFALQKRLPIAIITADTFRIGAVSQLRTYSELIQAPLDVAYTPQELSQLVVKHRDKALILVDTPGRSPADRDSLAVLDGFVAAIERPHLQIALAAGTPLADARRILDRFAVAPPQGVILTKLDETEQVGPVCALLAERQLPLSYFTNGQRVPEDIAVASNDALLDQLLQTAGSHLAGEKAALPSPSQRPPSANPALFQRFADFTQA